MMRDAIENFHNQFKYQPIIKNPKGLKSKYEQYIVAGMGGSHLAGDLILAYDPALPLVVWSDYGLPPLPERKLKTSLVICSSYSGNTEEVVESYRQAKRRKIPIACVSVGGKLIKMAKRDGVPYVQMPDIGIQPRSALGFSLRALMRVLGRDDILKQTEKLASILQPKKLEKVGKRIAREIKDRVPIIYSSRRNKTIAWNWKIKLNETGKIPAFYNIFPELNHNEMTGFDIKSASRHLSELFYFIFLKDSADYKKIQRRMDVAEKLYKERGLPVIMIDLKGRGVFEKIFNALLAADWTALYSAELYGLESEQVPMVEEFKRLIK